MRGFWLDLLTLLYYAYDDPATPSPPSPSSSLTPNPTQIFPNATYPDAVDPAATAGSVFDESSRPFYPSPWANGKGDWASAYAQAKAFVSQLTLLEKINITTGVG